MARKWKRQLHGLLAAILILACVPWVHPSGAEAATAYFTFNDYSTNANDPTPVSSSSINLAGTFNSVTATSISYRVEKLNGDPADNDVAETSIGTTSPQISDLNYLFTGVAIFNGLNRITVIGQSNAGSTVEVSAFVYFGNVPAITSISLSDNTLLVDGSPSVVGTAMPAILVKTTNAEGVTINGVAAYNGGGGTYIVSTMTLSEGLNPLTIVASNPTKTTTLNRQLVYYANSDPAAYNLKSGTTVLDGNQSVEPDASAAASKPISGTLIYTRPATPTTAIPSVKAVVYNGSTLIGTYDADVTEATSSYPNWKEFKFVTQAPVPLLDEGNYTVQILGEDYGTVDADSTIAFRVRSANSVAITDIKRLYGAKINADDEVTYDSSTMLTDNATVLETPLYVEVDAANAKPTDTYTLTASVDGVASASFNADKLATTDGKTVFRINAMPEGEVLLTFTVGSDQQTRTITFVPAPSIEITNIYNGQKFTTAGQLASTTVSGRVVNFNLQSDADKDSVRFTMNGKQFAVALTAAGTFSISDAATLTLVPGANVITMSGRANGVPVTTTLAVFFFSDDEPKVYTVTPVPVTDADSTTTPDADDQIVQSGTSNSYTTTLNNVDILFDATNVSTVTIKVDGVDYAYADGSTLATHDASRLKVVRSSDPYKLRIFLPLPTSSPRSVTITGIQGTVSVSETVTITREIPAFEVLSPKLPEERVMNQNFMDVVIRAEGATSVTIGKTAMTKDATQDVFRYTYTGMKSGTNTIKFTVVKAAQSFDGSIVVNYVADTSVGAQYRTVIPTSGKVSVFNGAVSITLPKNTLLKPAAASNDTIDLFDSQQVLFGIADSTDGRTRKTVNNDGMIMPIPTNPQAKSMLGTSTQSHFGLKSALYWIDPGYAKNNVLVQQGYTFIEGDHPYKTGINNVPFFSRNIDNYWLVPTQRGKITIEYDNTIVNAAAANLSIWRFYKDKWVNLGGKVDTGKHTVTTDFDGFGYYAVKILSYSFNDIVGHDYARNSLEVMYSRGILEPKSASEFGVYDNITRGEFAQVLVKMLNLPLDYDNSNLSFDDVPALSVTGALWDYRYIETAVRKGIIRGKGPRLFLPNEPLTREEAAVMIARATNLLKGKEDADKDRTTLTKQFTDGTAIGYYSVSSVLAVYKAGYIAGIPNTTTGTTKATFRFDPTSNLKRADAAIIAERVMKKAKLL